MRYMNHINRKNTRAEKDWGVSIIMLTHNAPEYVKLSLETLKKTECEMPVEVIVVDNASEPETRRLLLELYGGVY